MARKAMKRSAPSNKLLAGAEIVYAPAGKKPMKKTEVIRVPEEVVEQCKVWDDHGTYRILLQISIDQVLYRQKIVADSQRQKMARTNTYLNLGLSDEAGSIRKQIFGKYLNSFQVLPVCAAGCHLNVTGSLLVDFTTEPRVGAGTPVDELPPAAQDATTPCAPAGRVVHDVEAMEVWQAGPPLPALFAPGATCFPFAPPSPLAPVSPSIEGAFLAPPAPLLPAPSDTWFPELSDLIAADYLTETQIPAGLMSQSATTINPAGGDLAAAWGDMGGSFPWSQVPLGTTGAAASTGVGAGAGAASTSLPRFGAPGDWFGMAPVGAPAPAAAAAAAAAAASMPGGAAAAAAAASAAAVPTVPPSAARSGWGEPLPAPAPPPAAPAAAAAAPVPTASATAASARYDWGGLMMPDPTPPLAASAAAAGRWDYGGLLPAPAPPRTASSSSLFSGAATAGISSTAAGDEADFQLSQEMFFDLAPPHSNGAFFSDDQGNEITLEADSMLDDVGGAHSKLEEENRKLKQQCAVLTQLLERKHEEVAALQMWVVALGGACTGGP